MHLMFLPAKHRFKSQLSEEFYNIFSSIRRSIVPSIVRDEC